MDTLNIIYLIVSGIIIIFQYWYIRRLRRILEFTIETLRRYGNAFINDDMAELERIDNDIKNFK